MREIEIFLKDYWYATRSIGRLMLDLSAARHAYEQSRQYIPSTGGLIKTNKSRYAHDSAVEKAVILAVDQFRAEVESIERRLNYERRTIEIIEQTVANARLSAPEAAYIRLRYFEGKSVEASAQRLFCSVATAGRIRVCALDKIENAVGKENIAKAL